MTAPLIPPEILLPVEHTPRIIALVDLHEQDKHGFRVVWPPSRAYQTYTDIYITEKNGKYQLVNQMNTIGHQSIIQDFDKQELPDKSKLLEIAHQCAMVKAKSLADDLKDNVEDQSSYK